MTTRSALLVGSMPFDDEETCMRRALDHLGPYLFSLPDGEIGDKTPEFPKGNRIAWVIYAIERLTADRESWQIVKQPVRGEDGMAVDYNGIQKLKPLRPPKEMAQYVNFGYDEFFRKSYPLFSSLRHERGLKGLKFQVGIPTGFAMGFAHASQLNWLRYTNAMNSALAREMNRIVAEAGDDVIIQIEVPPELYAATMLPGPLMALALRPILDLLGKITLGTQIGIHLCLGDFHNEALIHPKTLNKMVAFSNLLVSKWPSAHKLMYIHYPFAEGYVPPTTDASYYQPLKDVHLPALTRFVAGFVHEKLSRDDNVKILDAIEKARGHSVDIACSCGLGRRTPQEATQCLEMIKEVIVH